MAGQEKFSIQACHLPQCGSPLDRIPLNLLRVPAVGRYPNKQVSRAENAPLRRPHPSGIIGLTLVVKEFQVFAAERQAELLHIGLIRVAKLGWEQRRTKLKLSLIDDAVVAAGKGIAVKAQRKVLMRNHPDGAGIGLCFKLADSTHMINVAMGKHHGREGSLSPVSNR